METPSSTRRVTRSQGSAAAANCNINNIPMSRKTEDSENGEYKSRARTGNQQDRSALIDISNDSPIVGVAMGRLETPSSTMSKKMNNINQGKDTKTPGSGEALLRGQVKTLLQKVEEEAELSKLSLEQRPFLHLQGLFINSPMGMRLLAPTPANTPHVLNLFDDNESFKTSCLASVTPSPVQELLIISQMATTKMSVGTEQDGPESENNWISRSLLLDFSEKSEGSDSSECLSVLTNIGGEETEEGKEKSCMEEDDDSVWSVQVNASSRDDEEEENNNDDYAEAKEEDHEHEDEDEHDEEGGLVNELCEGMNKISINGEKIMAKFSGRHTRFMYNSDDELEGEEECGVKTEASPCIVRLKGWPTPKGKHLRFPEDEEDN